VRKLQYCEAEVHIFLNLPQGRGGGGRGNSFDAKGNFFHEKSFISSNLAIRWWGGENFSQGIIYP